MKSTKLSHLHGYNIVDEWRELRQNQRLEPVGSKKLRLALALTSSAFDAVRWQIFAPSATLAIVLVLATVQVIVRFRLFLHVSLTASFRHYFRLILFSAVIVALMVSGTFVIPVNLRQRMM